MQITAVSSRNCYINSMHITVSTKLFRITDRDYSYVVRLAGKLVKFMPWEDPDYPLLDVIIRKHKKKSLNHIEKRLIKEESVRPLHGHESIDNPIYYDGTLGLILPKKRIVAKMLGKSVHEAVKDGFDELFRELDIYKGAHFEEDSEYFDHRTIRKTD